MGGGSRPIESVGLGPPRPSAAVRVLLFGEVIAFCAVVAGCIWLAPRGEETFRWYNVALWAAAVVLPIGANLVHGDRPRDSGLRIDNLAASGLEVAIVTCVMAVPIVAAGIIWGGFHGSSWTKVLTRAGEFLAGAFVQQYLLQAFVLRRLRQGGLAAPVAVLAASALFALLHSPNWVVVLLTFVGAIFWCSLFLRRPNLFVLTVSHALIALLVYHGWSRAWHLGLTVGPKAVERALRYAL